MCTMKARALLAPVLMVVLVSPIAAFRREAHGTCFKEDGNCLKEDKVENSTAENGRADSRPTSSGSATRSEGICCCKVKSAEDCKEHHQPDTFRGYEDSKIFSKNWKIQMAAGQHVNGKCCVRFQATACDAIPNVAGSYSKTKKKWHTPDASAGETCAEVRDQDAHFGGHLAPIHGSLNPQPKKVRIHWVRHGLACHNVETKYAKGWDGCRWSGLHLLSGVYDPPLTNCGVYNSDKAASKLQSFKVWDDSGKTKVAQANQSTPAEAKTLLSTITFFASSSLLRAMQTAARVFPEANPIVALPYVHEKGNSFCNTPDPKDSNLTKQTAKLNQFTTSSASPSKKPSTRFDMRYLEEAALRNAKESYDKFKEFYLTTLLREYPANAVNAAIASHSGYIGSLLKKECPQEILAYPQQFHWKKKKIYQAEPEFKFKLNNNEAWTLEYTIERSSKGSLELKKHSCQRLNGLDVPMPQTICEKDYADCATAGTPLTWLKEKYEKAKKANETGACCMGGNGFVVQKNS